MNARNTEEQSRVSGLIGLLNPTEETVTRALLAGRNPAKALAEVRGKAKPTVHEDRDVRACMASERVRRTIAGITKVRGSDLKAFVLERLVTEAEDAREGATRLRAVEMIGNLPGVDAWKPQDDRAEGLEEAGSRLGEVLAAVQERLSEEVIDVVAVQAGPDVDDGPQPTAGDEVDPEPIDPFA